MMAALLVAAVALIGLLPVHGLSRPSAGAAAPPAAPCPGGVAQCVTVTAPCGTSPCPTVTAGPTVGVGAGQYVFLALSNYPAGDTVRMAYCPTPQPFTIVADPQCAQGPFLGTSLSPSVLPVQADGSLLASFPTAVDEENEGNAQIEAHQLVTTNPPPDEVKFNCGNNPDEVCSIEVTDDGPGVGLGAGNPDDTDVNTVVIPLSFAASGSGCPASDPLVFTESAFSVEHLIQPAIDSTCGSASGVADDNTATNSDQVVADFGGGNAPIAFTDDPDDPNQIAALKGKQYAYVPVAVSANVVAFLAGDIQQQEKVAYPVSAYNLTPNMVAGLITSNYTAPLGSDVLIPPLECDQIAGCSSTNTSVYNAFDLLNPAPPGLATPGEFNLSFSSVATGASYETTNWLCQAPNAPFTVSVPLIGGGPEAGALQGAKRTTTTTIPAPSPVSVTDTHLAATTLTTAPKGGIAWPPFASPDAPWPFTSCQAYPILPVLAASSAQYTFAQTPSAQALAIRKYAYGGGGAPVPQGSVSLAAFGAMDWSEAAYAGLPSASLQNASGNFVAPSAASVDAALADTTMDANGVVAYNYNNVNDPNAYPMPEVTYAIVSTAPQSAADAQAEGDLLANLVSYSHGGGSIPMPPGYVLMPDNLYKQANAEISKIFPTAVIPAPNTSPSSPKAIKPGGVVSPLATSSSGGAQSATATTAPTATAKMPIGKAKPVPLPPDFDPVVLALLTGKDGWILPGLIALMLLLFIAGPTFYGAPRLRRRLARVKDTEL
jgi:hypothetical protein